MGLLICYQITGRSDFLFWLLPPLLGPYVTCAYGEQQKHSGMREMLPAEMLLALSKAWQDVCIAMVCLHCGKATSWLCWKWHQFALPKTASTALTSRHASSPFHLQECWSLLVHPLLSMLCILAQNHSSWRETPQNPIFIHLCCCQCLSDNGTYECKSTPTPRFMRFSPASAAQGQQRDCRGAEGSWMP